MPISLGIRRPTWPSPFTMPLMEPAIRTVRTHAAAATEINTNAMVAVGRGGRIR